MRLLISCVFLQLGYTKKQEERHFRGVITLEVRSTNIPTIDFNFSF